MIEMVSQINLKKHKVINTYNIKFTIIRYCLYIIMVFLFAFFIFMFNGLIEMKPVSIICNDFKERGEYEDRILINGQVVYLYKVNKIYDYEKTGNTFHKEDNNYYIGGKLDIIITNRNPLRRVPTAIVQDIGNFFSKNFYIGHATINISDDGKTLIESVGNDDGFRGVRIKENKWLDEISSENDAQQIIGLRVKNVSNEVEDKIISDLKEKEGLKYNYNFLIHKNKSYYCTDLITRIFRKNGINIDYDCLYPTGNDLIISNNTYIFFVCERTKDGDFNIYYLSEETK